MIEINWFLEILDTIISLSGHYGRWLNANKKRICFIIWAICTIYWAARDFSLGLYSQALFCLISVCINIYGYIKWGNDKNNLVTTNESDLKWEFAKK